MTAPVYDRLLRLRHIAPSTWQRAVLGEGVLALAILLALAEVASAWVVVVLPLAVALVVKAHDLLQGLLEPRPATAGRAVARPPAAWHPAWYRTVRAWVGWVGWVVSQTTERRPRRDRRDVRR